MVATVAVISPEDAGLSRAFFFLAVGVARTDRCLAIGKHDPPCY